MNQKRHYAPGNFREAKLAGTQDDQLDIYPAWFRDCKNNDHAVDVYIEDEKAVFECADCNKSSQD